MSTGEEREFAEGGEWERKDNASCSHGRTWLWVVLPSSHRKGHMCLVCCLSKLLTNEDVTCSTILGKKQHLLRRCLRQSIVCQSVSFLSLWPCRCVWYMLFVCHRVAPFTWACHLLNSYMHMCKFRKWYKDLTWRITHIRLLWAFWSYKMSCVGGGGVLLSPKIQWHDTH